MNPKKSQLIALLCFATFFSHNTVELKASDRSCDTVNKLGELSTNRSVPIVRDSPAFLKTLSNAELLEKMALEWEQDPGATELKMFELAKSWMRSAIRMFPESQKPDILQNTFIKINRSIKERGFDQVFRKNILSVYNRSAYNMAVSMNRGASSKDVESSTLDGDSSTSYLSSIPDRVGDLDQVLRNQFKSAFEDVLSTMTEKRRTALTMLSQGYEAPEIAKTMGIKTNAVYKLIFDARKNAREGLLERGIDSTFFDER